MLFSRVFCLNDSSFAGLLPNNLENFQSFQDLLMCLGEVGLMVGTGLGSSFGGDGVFLKLVKGGFLIGCGWAPLGPDLIPYLMEDFLLHSAMYFR